MKHIFILANTHECAPVPISYRPRYFWSFGVSTAAFNQVKRDNADCEIVLNEYTAGHEYDARYLALMSFKVK